MNCFQKGFDPFMLFLNELLTFTNQSLIGFVDGFVHITSPLLKISGYMLKPAP